MTKLKAFSYLLYLEGLGFRAIGRLLNVSNVTVLRWIRALSKEYEIKKETSTRYTSVIEIDEMWHYIGKKKGKYGFGLLFVEAPEKCLAGKWVVVGRKV